MNTCQGPCWGAGHIGSSKTKPSPSSLGVDTLVEEPKINMFGSKRY